MSKTKDKRNPRMTLNQKEGLLRLIEEYFDQIKENCVNVNEKDIGPDTWKIFADQLNVLGPPKDVENWKTSFHYMKLRVKAKLDAAMKKSFEDKQPLNINNNLSVIDRKIVDMFFTTTLVIANADGSVGAVGAVPPSINSVVVEADHSNELSQLDYSLLSQDALTKILTSLDYSDLCVMHNARGEGSNDFVAREPKMSTQTKTEQSVYGSTVTVDGTITDASALNLNGVIVEDVESNERDLMVGQNNLTALRSSSNDSNFGGVSTVNDDVIETSDSDGFVTIEPINSMRITTVTSLYGSAVSEVSEFTDETAGDNDETIFKKPRSEIRTAPSRLASTKGVIQLDPDMVGENNLTTLHTSNDSNFGGFPTVTSESDSSVTREPINNIRMTTVTSLYGSAVSEVSEYTDETTGDHDETIFKKPRSAIRSAKRRVGSAKGVIRRIQRGNIRSALRTGIRPVFRKATVITKPRGNVISARGTRGAQRISASGSRGVPDQRVSLEQKRRLLHLVEYNFLRTVGRFSGFNGVIIKRRLWEEYAKELNALGPPYRTAKGWEKAFTSIRLSAKSKVAKIRHERNKTGKNQSKLTEMDEKILTMFGTDILDGNQELGEGGFPYEKTLPFQDDFDSNTVDVTDDSLCRSPETVQNAAALADEVIDYVNDPVALSERINRLMSHNVDGIVTPKAHTGEVSTLTPNVNNTSAEGTYRVAREIQCRSENRRQSEVREQNEAGPTAKRTQIISDNSTQKTHNRAPAAASGNAVSVSRQSEVRLPNAAESGANLTQNISDYRTQETPYSHTRNRAPAAACLNPVSVSRDRKRNRHTSFEMVQRSTNAQEQFIEQSERNHNEIMGFLTSALQEFTAVLREYLNKNIQN